MISASEIWKTIPGYDGFYEVSTEGRVRSTRYHKSGYHYLTPQDNGHGYLRVCLGGRYVQVSRLVATAFCEKSGGRDYVDHINHSTHDNRACNLRWVTRKENDANRSPARPKPPKCRKSTTGEKYIYPYPYDPARYVLAVPGRRRTIHASIAEAVEIRDNYLL